MKKILFCFLLSFLFSPHLYLHASIIKTEAAVGLQLNSFGYWTATGQWDYLIKVYGEDQGNTYASVFLTDSYGIGTASFAITLPTNEKAVIDFSRSLDGSAYPINTQGLFGDITWKPTPINYFLINYHTENDAVLRYGWNFDYYGDNPVGMGVVIMPTYEYLGSNYGTGGPFVGSEVFNLEANRDYTFLTQVYTVTSGSIWCLDGSLSGQITFDFTPTTVPEPATILLLGLGLMGLAGIRRKFQK